MRNEITKARDGEKEAIENNKTIIATLSHDIKTPMTVIMGYLEIIRLNGEIWTTPLKKDSVTFL